MEEEEEEEEAGEEQGEEGEAAGEPEVLVSSFWIMSWFNIFTVS